MIVSLREETAYRIDLPSRENLATSVEIPGTMTLHFLSAMESS
jgi:hypothetical protein